MPEFLHLLPPREAYARLLRHLPDAEPVAETLDVVHALGRVLAEDVRAPHPLPEFPRSSVDGYAVRAADTYGASESLPAYLTLVGEVPMGAAPEFALAAGQAALIHTGGMLPEGADAVVMLEYTQTAREGEVEILRAVADGENVIRVGEDVAEGQVVMRKGSPIREAEVGGLMALGVESVRVARKVRVGVISTGDEVVPPSQRPAPGQVRDINSYTLSALVEHYGGEARRYGIVPDRFEALREVAERALSECDMVLITAGSSASTRDMTAEVINSLGKPGVVVHGINTRPGKPTILGVCDGKAVIGLPGNPVSALVNGYMLVAPLIERLLGKRPRPRPTVRARLTVNLPSQAGREDWWPVRLLDGEDGEYRADPIFGKSNLIFTLVAANGLLRIPPDATGLSAGEVVEVMLI
ncbi:MAG: molybdopterin molybdenumtransferase MoeA [Anaerolineae bacterium]|nr:MAG: molybdopterin molybdenumtransferase MoeA [Anaerolineae bacterium]